MEENTLRGMIKSQIKKFITEAPNARQTVAKKLGSVEKMAGIKMLKKALGQGSATQQAAGLLAVVKSISGNNPLVSKKLAIMLRGQKPEAPEAPAVEESSPNFAVQEKVSSALTSKMGRVDKTQAMQMMKKTLATKPATQQVDFVISMLNDFGLKDSAKKRLILKLRKELN